MKEFRSYFEETMKTNMRLFNKDIFSIGELTGHNNVQHSIEFYINRGGKARVVYNKVDYPYVGFLKLKYGITSDGDFAPIRVINARKVDKEVYIGRMLMNIIYYTLLHKESDSLKPMLEKIRNMSRGSGVLMMLSAMFDDRRDPVDFRISPDFKLISYNKEKNFNINELKKLVDKHTGNSINWKQIIIDKASEK